MRFEGKAVLVTGASRGIGRAVAIELGRRGATVAVHFRERADAAAEVVDAVHSAGGHAFAVERDLAQADGPSRLVDAVRAGLASNGAPPALHGLVSNAGALVVGDLEQVTAADFDRAFSLNTRAALLLVQAALPLFPHGSRIVTVSAAITRYANPALLAQSAAKAALQDLSRNLAVSLGARGITVVDVAPGPTRTELAAGLLAMPGEEAEIAHASALGRVAEPEDVADAIVALLEPGTRWVTGQSIDLSGGYRV